MTSSKAVLEALIEACVQLKRGNKEFVLFRNGPNEWKPYVYWSCEIGNPVPHAVRLGESSGEFCGEGRTAQEAVANLIVNLMAWRKVNDAS